MNSSRIPNSFLISGFHENRENSAAQTQPAMMAGTSGEIFSSACFHRMVQAISADGRKNSKLMILAVCGSFPRISVSQRINKLPPPTPNPLRNPSTVAIITAMGNDSNINSESLPIESERQGFCGAIRSELYDQIERPDSRQCRCRYNRAVLFSIFRLMVSR